MDHATPYRCLFHGVEPQLLDDGTERNFQFLHGEPHADAVAWTQSERKESVRVQVVFVLRCPTLKIRSSKSSVRNPINCLPIRIELFRIRVEFLRVMNCVNGYADHNSFFYFNSVVGDVFVTFPLQPESSFIFKLFWPPKRINYLGTGEYMRSTSWITWSTYGKSKIISWHTSP